MLYHMDMGCHDNYDSFAINNLISEICSQHVGNNLIIGNFNCHIDWSIHDLTTNDSNIQKFYEVIQKKLFNMFTTLPGVEALTNPLFWIWC